MILLMNWHRLQAGLKGASGGPWVYLVDEGRNVTDFLIDVARLERWRYAAQGNLTSRTLHTNQSFPTSLFVRTHSLLPRLIIRTYTGSLPNT